VALDEPDSGNRRCYVRLEVRACGLAHCEESDYIDYMRKIIFIALLVFVFAAAGIFWFTDKNPKVTTCAQDTFVCPDGSVVERIGFQCEFAACPGNAEEETSENSANLPVRKTIAGLQHVFQTFNNCSSVALVVAFSKYGVSDTQEAIAAGTRPWNNRNGDNDDKSVTLYEMADYASATHGLAAYVRPNGDIELLKRFIANDIPVIARARMYPNQEYVHYRVVKGYDEARDIIIESDGIEGPNREYSYDEWLHLWEEFNYSYLIAVPNNVRPLVEEILGEERDERTAWGGARARAERDIAADPNDKSATYNLVTALYYLGDYKGVVREFEKIEAQLPPHKLWYQDEPIYAYYELGNYDRVLSLVEKVIGDRNKSVSELYVLRGKIYLSRADENAARAEFEKAIHYNNTLVSAKDALASLDGR